MLAQGAGDLHGLDAGTHGLAVPLAEKLAGAAQRWLKSQTGLCRACQPRYGKIGLEFALCRPAEIASAKHRGTAESAAAKAARRVRAAASSHSLTKEPELAPYSRGTRSAIEAGTRRLRVFAQGGNPVLQCAQADSQHLGGELAVALHVFESEFNVG